MSARVGPPRGGFSLDARNGAGRAAGREAQRSGASFQQDIKTSSTWYEARGLATVLEVPVETFGTAQHRKFAGRRGSVDFAGLVVPDDAHTRPIAFDAKVTTGKAMFTLSHDDPRERQRTALQIRWLRQFKAMGGLAGFLCLDRDLFDGAGGLFWLDADALAPLASDAAAVGARAAGDEAVVIRYRPRGGGLDSPHPWCAVSPLAAVATNAAPLVRWRELALAPAGGPLALPRGWPPGEDR